MRIQILGSGNAFHSSGRAHAAYLIDSANGSCVLLDCGATTLYRLQQINFDFNRLDAVLLTHFHGDHFAGLPFLWIQMWIVDKRERPLKIIGPVGVKKKCKALMDICYPDFFDSCDLEFYEVEPTSGIAPLFENTDLRVQPFLLNHRPESLGYRLVDNGGVFAFSGDSGFDENLFDLVNGVDVALIELSVFSHDGSPIGHVSLEQIKSGIQKIKARKIIFTHIYDDLAESAKALGFQVAFDGMTIDV